MKLSSLRILSVAAQVLNTKLLESPGAKEAATILAQGLISSLEVEDSKEHIELMSGLVVNLAEILGTRELLALIHALQEPAKKFPMSAWAVLVLSISLVMKNAISIDEVKSVSNELFEGSDEGKRMVIEELVMTDDARFKEIGRAIAPNAAVVIASPNEELRKALAMFFVRISKSWSPGDFK
jgi:hypothetical protein